MVDERLQIPATLTEPESLEVLDDILAALSKLLAFYEPTSVSLDRQLVASIVPAALDLRERGRSALEVYINAVDVNTFYLEGSYNGLYWDLTDTFTFAVVGEDHRGYVNAYPYVRVRPDAAGRHLIRLSASI